MNILGLKPVGSVFAPAISLTAQNKKPWTLESARGRVVVLTFFDARCLDICPVLGAELARARQLLGPRARVTFVVVNTNPFDLDPSSPPALSETGLANLANVYFLNGQLNALTNVWSNYGVQVRVTAKHQQFHNNVMYFITPGGRINALASPFANEDRRARFTLPRAQIERFARGVAQLASNLETS